MLTIQDGGSLFLQEGGSLFLKKSSFLFSVQELAWLGLFVVGLMITTGLLINLKKRNGDVGEDSS